MHVLDFLRGNGADIAERDSVGFEFRLICSGELYNSAVLTTDWRKSTATRLLTAEPFELIVCSHPFDDYPQELVLRFSASIVTESDASGVAMFYPDEDIARDMSAMLTLLLRRLITVAAKAREIRSRRYPQEPSFLLDYPFGFLRDFAPVSWERKPAVIVYGPDGIEDITHYNPPPLGIDPDELSKRLKAWSASPFGEALVHSARLYSIALQELERDPGMTYQLLVSCVEAIAGEVLRDYVPDQTDLVETKRTVLDLALEYGLDNESAEALAIEACSGMSWTARKFTKFLLDYAGEEIWTEDDLFHLPESFLPKRDQFERALRSIYAARGRATHAGRPFPSRVGLGIGPTMPSRVLIDIDLSGSSQPVPPVVWFERVVNSALNRYIESTAFGNDEVSRDHGQDDA